MAPGPRLRCAAALLLAWALGPLTVQAQGTSGPTVADSKVGYLDNPIPGNVFRFNFDAAYDFTRPTRAEFFYPQGAPSGGPGLARPERRVDYQELGLYAEYAFSPVFSVFLEQPYRMLNPQVNADHSGLADLDAGFKYAFLRQDDRVVSFQFRTYAPTGDAHEGLGTRHVTLEPGLLLYQSISDRLAVNGELRYWAPIGGTNFAGDIIRYGAGVQYDVYRDGARRVTPVIEMVGWTVLGGKEAFLTPSGVNRIVDAAGDTIVNLKLGMRVSFSETVDFYAGYGRPLTGETWYQNIFRVQLRILY
jgi:hypothetical protein